MKEQGVLCCDECGGRFNALKDVWVEWVVDGECRVIELRVVHHKSASGRVGGCYLRDISGGRRLYDHHAARFIRDGRLTVLHDIVQDFGFAEQVKGIESVLLLELQWQRLAQGVKEAA